jgi:hypothetical protein
MIIRWIAILVASASLAACASSPAPQVAAADQVWNGGIWNSMLGYHGPANGAVSGGPSR